MPNISHPIAAFTICGLEVAVSNKTIDYMIEYQAFKSAGPAWLARNDPKCKIEQSIIDSVRSSLEEDIYAWSADFSEDLQEKVENEQFVAQDTRRHSSWRFLKIIKSNKLALVFFEN